MFHLIYFAHTSTPNLSPSIFPSYEPSDKPSTAPSNAPSVGTIIKGLVIGLQVDNLGTHTITGGSMKRFNVIVPVRSSQEDPLTPSQINVNTLQLWEEQVNSIFLSAFFFSFINVVVVVIVVVVVAVHQ